MQLTHEIIHEHKNTHTILTIKSDVRNTEYVKNRWKIWPWYLKSLALG